MRCVVVSIVLFSFVNLNFGDTSSNAAPINFRKAMVNCPRLENKLTQLMGNSALRNLLSKFEQSFQRFCASQEGSGVVIPKIIHQIWIGKKKTPPRCFPWMAAWKERFPGWTYILWTDDMVASVHLLNTNLYIRSPNMGERSDILRYELLYQYGGVYVDVDFEPLDPEFFEQLHERCDFYAGLLPPEKDIVVANGLIGCKPGHPLMLDIINALKTSWYKDAEIVDRTGPEFMTTVLAESPNFTNGLNVILPANMLYPFSWAQLEGDYKQWIKPETIAVHYFTGTWR
jgi:mannosyltransferase OCH1-like enzyme